MATSLSNLLALLALDNSAYLDGLTSSQSASDSFADKLSNVGGAVVLGGLTVAATAVTAVGAAAWDAGNQFDEAMDTIAVATGATGPELEGLREDFEAVFTSIPTDAKTAADAIGILNSRLDLSGPALQNIAKPLIEASRLLGGDVTANAQEFTRVIGDWNIPVENASGSLDKLFVAAQQSGVPLDQLMQRIVQYGAPMRNFGFDFNEAAVLLATFEAQGVNTEIVMSGLRTAQGQFIKNGVDMKTGLWETIEAIQNAESSTDALAIATEVFGAKAAGDMFDTIRSGKFDIQELVGALQNADGAILETADATSDWAEKWQTFKNKITTALAPVGEAMMDGLGKAMDSVAEIFERPDVQEGLTKFTELIGTFITKIVEHIPPLIDGFFRFVEFLKNNQGIVVAVLTALGAAALVWGYTTAAAAITAITPLLPVIAVILLIAAVVYLLYEAWNNNFMGIRDTVMNLWAGMQPVFAALREWLSVVIPAALQVLKDWWDQAIQNWQMVWNFLQTYILPVFQAVANLIGAVLNLALEVMAGIIQNIIVPALTSLWSWIDEKIMPVIMKLASWLREKLGPAFDRIGEAIRGVVAWINKLSSNISNIKLPKWLTPGSPTPFETGLRGIASAMADVNQAKFPAFQSDVSVTRRDERGRGGAGNGDTYITINNPIPEPSSDSIRRTLKRQSYLGAVA